MPAILLALVLAASAVAAPPAVDVSYRTDPRVEVVAVLEMLARPEEFKVRVGTPMPPYAARAWKRFATHAGHPAVARVRAMTESERQDAVETALGLGDPPGFAGEELGAFAALFREAGAFAKETRFDRYYKDEAKARAEFARAAETESVRALTPESMAKYLRLPPSGRHVFVLSPLLPPALAANETIGGGAGAIYYRVRAAEWRKKSPWDFGEFGSNAAHELGHDLLQPFVDSDKAGLAAGAPLFKPDCGPNWETCAIEQIDVAVTLRALAAERGEAEAARTGAIYEPKYAQLAALEARLREWEDFPGSFAEFWPRLLAVFSEETAKAAAPEPPRRRPRP